MSPRKRPSEIPGKPGRGKGPAPYISLEHEEMRRGNTWTIRQMKGSPEPGAYRCPGCDQEIPKSLPHVVVWRSQSILSDGVEGRRHWHTPCWARYR